MNLLFTGRGKAGSWRIRGEQVGHALGADVIPLARDVARYDSVVLVKRAPGEVLNRIHAAGATLVWDIVDPWPQPEGNRWTRAESLAWLADQIERNAPHAIIAATEAMKTDVGLLCGRPVVAIPHHGRPGAERTEIREHLQTVAYEGNLSQLGIWGDHLIRACGKRGITVLFNPPSLNDADVVVALREADGYAARFWKSNVKLANAQATGTPIICVPEAGYLETKGASQPLFVDTPAELGEALDRLADRATRQHLADGLYAARIDLEAVTRAYAHFLGTVCTTAPSF